MKLLFLSFLGYLSISVFSLACASSAEQTKAYQQLSANSMIKIAPAPPAKKPKVKDLFPLGVIVKPTLNGNFYLQQQYRAAQKRAVKRPTADNRSPRS